MVSVDGSKVIDVAGTRTGRIFVAMQDGSIQELLYDSYVAPCLSVHA